MTKYTVHFRPGTSHLEKYVVEADSLEVASVGYTFYKHTASGGSAADIRTVVAQFPSETVAGIIV